MAGLACIGGSAFRAPDQGDTNVLPDFAARTGTRPEPRRSGSLDAPALRHIEPSARETFVAEAKLASDLERQSPGILRKIAESMGMADDFAKWEA